MTLKNSIRTDMVDVFLNENEFAEEIRYYFKAGGATTISAIVERQPPAYFDAAGNVVLPSYIITIHNNETTGVLADKIDTGGDEVELFDEFQATRLERVTVLSVLQRDFGGAVKLSLK